MQPSLVKSLIHWTTEITGISFPQTMSPSQYKKMFRSLLLEIDFQFFSPLKQDSTTITQITNLIQTYYSSNMDSHLSSSSVPSNLQLLTDTKVSQIFQLIFGIGFKVDHSKYVMQILSLQQSDQEILMSFVDTLIKGEPEPAEDNKNQIKRILQELERKEFQNKVIKERNEQLEQSLYELKQRIIILKDENDKMIEQLNQLQSQKTQLLIQLGMNNHYSPSYQEIVKRYKENIKNYQGKLQELQCFLDSKNSQIQERSSEIQLLRQSIGSKKQLQEQKNYKTQEQTKQLYQKNQQIQQYKRQIQILNEQIAAKNQRVTELNKDKNRQLEEIKEHKMNMLKLEKAFDKYKQLKKLYKGFIGAIKPHIDR